MQASTPTALSFEPLPERILLILPTWVGDVVMATPIIAALFERFPDADFTLVMHRHLASLVEGSPWTAKQQYWPPRKKTAEAKNAQKEFVRALKAEQFDLAIMLPNSFRSAWLCRRVGAKRRVGFNRDGRGLLLTDRIAVPNRMSNRSSNKSGQAHPGPFAPMPLVDYYAHLALTLGCKHPGDALALYTSEAEDEAISGILSRASVDPNKPLVVLCPGANFGASKCWPPERFAAVADALVQNQGATIAISPGPGEEPLAEAIANTMQQPCLLLTEPCITLGELKSLIKRCNLLLGNDTGPRHFARAFNVHRVTVFGPTEERWTDTSHGRETIVRVNVPCGPCHQKVCPLAHQVCMEDVTVDMVRTACEQELQAASSIVHVER